MTESLIRQGAVIMWLMAFSFNLHWAKSLDRPYSATLLNLFLGRVTHVRGILGLARNDELLIRILLNEAMVCDSGI